MFTTCKRCMCTVGCVRTMRLICVQCTVYRVLLPGRKQITEVLNQPGAHHSTYTHLYGPSAA